MRILLEKNMSKAIARKTHGEMEGMFCKMEET